MRMDAAPGDEGYEFCDPASPDDDGSVPKTARTSRNRLRGRMSKAMKPATKGR